jgi:hypothetical protein
VQWENDDALEVVGWEIDDKTRRDDRKNEQMLLDENVHFKLYGIILTGYGSCLDGIRECGRFHWDGCLLIVLR